MRERIYDEYNREIGWKDENSSEILYYTYKHGCVGKYLKSAKQYIRVKQRPGVYTQPFPGKDYGEIDVLYWGSQR